MDIICCGIFEALKDGDDDDEDIKEALHIDAAVVFIFPCHFIFYTYIITSLNICRVFHQRK
jgi:hypothetical protein